MLTLNIDLRNKQWLTLGKKNTGKSGFNHYLMSKIRGNYAVFDPGKEHFDYKEDDLIVNPSVLRGEEAINQLNDFVDFATDNREVFDYIFVDEINRYHQKGGRLTGALGELVDMSAHYSEGLGVGFIARRPTQVHTDLRELSDYLFVFRLTGVNDIRTLDEISSGLGERVANLEDYEFMIVHPNGDYEKHKPIDVSDLRHDKGI